ncbi:MAG: Lcl C-terminal domain-containing protein, partial [Planctomycetota bacterium]
RFAVSDEGTAADTSDDVVLDRATGLMWARDANLAGTKNWTDAMDYCDSLELGRTGTLATDWRLPSIDELTSLSEPHPSTHTPALPEGHPFVNVQYLTDHYYWSSTHDETNSNLAWTVHMSSGSVFTFAKHGLSASFYVWPMRGGN